MPIKFLDAQDRRLENFMTNEQKLVIETLVKHGFTRHPWADPIYAVGRALGVNPNEASESVEEAQRRGWIVLRTDGTDRIKNPKAPASEWVWERP